MPPVPSRIHALGLLVYSRDEDFLPRVVALDKYHQYCARLISEFGLHVDHEVVNYIAFHTDIAKAQPLLVNPFEVSFTDELEDGNLVEYELIKCG